MKRQNTKIPVYDAEYIEHSTGPWRHKPRPRRYRIAHGLRGMIGLSLVGIAAIMLAFIYAAARIY